MLQNPKLGESSRDGPHFSSPWGSRNPPKSDEKSILRAFLLEVIFGTLSKRLRMLLGGLLR